MSLYFIKIILSQGEIVQEAHEDKSILITGNNSNSMFCLSNRTKDRTLTEEQSVFLRNINRTPILTSSCPNIYENSNNNSIYGNNSLLK